MSTLEWDTPLACPSAAEFEATIDRYLGPEAARSDSSDDLSEVRVHVEPAHGYGWRLVLELRGVYIGVARHNLFGSDCRELIARAAALIATTLDPFALELQWWDSALVPIIVELPLTVVEALAEPVSEASEATIDPDSAPIEVALHEHRPADAPVADTHEQRVVVGGFASASASLALNLFDNPNPGVHAQLGVERGLFRASVHGGLELAGRFRAVENPEIGGDLLAWDLGLRGCVVPRWGRAQLRGCAAAGAGQVRARGVRVQNPEGVGSPWIWLAPELGFAWSIVPRVALLLDLGLGLSLVRPRFAVTQPDHLYTTDLVSGRGRLGLELRFPKP